MFKFLKEKLGNLFKKVGKKRKSKRKSLRKLESRKKK